MSGNGAAITITRSCRAGLIRICTNRRACPTATEPIRAFAAAAPGSSRGGPAARPAACVTNRTGDPITLGFASLPSSVEGRSPIGTYLWSWHSRDYGVIVPNGFDKRALPASPDGKLVVKSVDSLKLRYDVLLFDTPSAAPIDFAAAYRRLQVDVRPCPLTNGCITRPEVRVSTRHEPPARPAQGRRRADGEEQQRGPEQSRHVSGRQSVEEDRQDLPDADRQREADAQADGHEPRALPEHHPDDAGVRGPQRETNGELPASERHGIRRHTVDAHRRQQQRHQPHGSADGREHALRRQPQRDRIGE